MAFLLKPGPDRVVVERIGFNRPAPHIYLGSELTWGKVVAVGQKARDFPFCYAEGDTVLISYSGGFHARMASTKYGDSKEYYIVKADDIMGTLPSK